MRGESLGCLLSALLPLCQTVSRRTVVINGIISGDSNPRQRLTQQKCQLFLLLWFLVAKGTLKPVVEPSNESFGSDRPSHRNAEPWAGRFAPSSAHLGSSGAPRPVSSTRAVPRFLSISGLEMWAWPGSLCWILSTTSGKLISSSLTGSHHKFFFPGFYLPYADWFSVLLLGSVFTISRLISHL